jgi:hypothetical protein
MVHSCSPQLTLNHKKRKTNTEALKLLLVYKFKKKEAKAAPLSLRWHAQLQLFSNDITQKLHSSSCGIGSLKGKKAVFLQKKILRDHFFWKKKD